MGSLLNTIVYFVLALGLLVAFHEFGHFWVARRCGVKVLRFSIGFGKPLWRYQKTPDSTEFIVAAVPLGGYVKMVDEREGEVSAEDLPYAFNRQSLPVRTAIVLAGPVFNLLLAVLIYWFVFWVGDTGVRPVLGAVDPGSFAEQAGFEKGDEILSVSGQETPTWGLTMSRLFALIMDGDPIRIEVQSADGVKHTRELVIPEAASMEPELLRSRLGFHPWEPVLAPRIDAVEENGPAAKAGLQKGDRIVSADGVPIRDWRQWVGYVRERPNQEIRVTVDRDGVQVTLSLRPVAVRSAGGEIGRIGTSVSIPPDVLKEMRVEYRLGFFSAFATAVKKTADFSLLTLKMIGRMIIGKASVENLSGPISIAQYAGQSANLGLMQFMKFLAVVSISLGVLNLLPVPVLDGGHLLFYLIEAIKGSPLSEKAQAIGQQIGIVILISLMGLAFFLDIERLLN
jgi:regulator of sigma E protease